MISAHERGRRVGETATLGNGPRCPHCGERRVWTSWFDMADTCPGCGFRFARHGWLAAMWILMWFTMIPVVAWIVIGIAISNPSASAWVPWGAVLLAVAIPPVSYRYAKGLMVRLLFTLDPPTPHLPTSGRSRS